MKVGSDREAASSPVAPKPGLDEIGTLAIQILSAGTLQNWPCFQRFTPINSHILRWDFPLKINGFLRKILIVLAI